MAARVVGDQAVAAPQQGARALHDVAARGRQAVQQHDRRPLPGQLPAQGEPAAVGLGPLDLEELRFQGAVGWHASTFSR